MEDRTERFPLGAAVTVEQLETDPYPVLAELRREEPVSWVPAIGAWLVTNRELAVEVMRAADRFTVDDPRFTTAQVLGPSMLSLDGPEHARLRSPFAPSFRPGIVREQFGDFLRDEVAGLIDKFDRGSNGRVELRTGLAGPLAVNTITRFLGLSDVDPADVLTWYTDISDAIVGLTKGVSVGERGHSAVGEINRRVTSTLERGAEDSLVRRVAASGALGTDELTSSVVVLMFGAIETSEGMTSNALWHLLSHPEWWAAITEGRSLIADVVEESLRMEPAAGVIDRYATDATTLGGVEIAARDAITVSLLGANRDPEIFTDPDRFDPTRDNLGQHVTFVQGAHGCLGLHLTRMETVAAINGLLDVMPGLHLDPGADRPEGLIFRKPNRLFALPAA